jgi:hypothetical protein
MGDKKKGTGKKNCFYKSPYNYLTICASDFQNLKSLTQLGALATQNYNKIGHQTYAPILRIPQKMPLFLEIIIFEGNHAVL